jgi:hypothetical protein
MVEVCYSAGMPTALIQRESCLESEVYISSPSPSLLADNLVELSSQLSQLSSNPDVPLPGEPAEERPLPRYRMVDFYEYLSELGSGSFSESILSDRFIYTAGTEYQVP